MFDYESHFKANPNGVLATCEGPHIRSRVFQFLFCIDGLMYFCTSNEKDVFQQLSTNPHVSFCSSAPNWSQVVSVSGTAHFQDSPELKKRTLDENPVIAGIFKTPENPVFTLFYVKVEQVATFSYKDGPRKYTMP